jgi:hypothetical protein
VRLCLSVTFLTCTAAFFVQAATCETPFEAPYRPGSDLTLELRSGDIDIRGTNSSVVRVECLAADARDIRVRFDEKAGKLTVDGGPSNNVRIRIEVPRETNLRLRCSAGDVDIADVRGHKDISLRAGDLKIDTGDPADYASVEAAVKAGDLRASAFGVHKGGLFRSFRHTTGGGKYRLKANLWAGEIVLR